MGFYFKDLTSHNSTTSSSLKISSILKHTICDVSKSVATLNGLYLESSVAKVLDENILKERQVVSRT